MNKAYSTNLIAALIFLCGYYLDEKYILAIGSYALSGAITNHLAIHMLFEKVPGFYGSGVIQLRFAELKNAIKALIMKEFFSEAQLNPYLKQQTNRFFSDFPIASLLEKVDFRHVFTHLTQSILQSEQGAMINMLGGESLLMAFETKFIEALKLNLSDQTFLDNLKAAFLESEKNLLDQNSIEQLIDERLSELTPKAVKRMIQDIIQQHLGWLVVWGGVFGGIIGLFASSLH